MYSREERGGPEVRFDPHSMLAASLHYYLVFYKKRDGEYQYFRKHYSHLCGPGNLPVYKCGILYSE